MKTRSSIIMSILVLTIGYGSGCAFLEAWQMDYGKPAAQFMQEDVETKGKEYIGKKITVKGTVSKTDFSDPENPLVYLDGGIRCNFGNMKRMAEGRKVGDTVYIDGFLKQCEKGNIVINPAINRDRTAPFNPK